MVDLKMLEEKTPILKEICSEKEVFWKIRTKQLVGKQWNRSNLVWKM